MKIHEIEKLGKCLGVAQELKNLCFHKGNDYNCNWYARESCSKPGEKKSIALQKPTWKLAKRKIIIDCSGLMKQTRIPRLILVT